MQGKSVEPYVQKWKKRGEMGCLVHCNSKVMISFQGVEEECFGINSIYINQIKVLDMDEPEL